MTSHTEALSDIQLVGQRLMVGFEGKTLDPHLAALITRFCVGGIALFKRNISDPEQLSTLCRQAQSLSKQNGNPPLLIAIDQEGGPVARLGPPFTTFPGNRAMGASRSEAAAEEFAVTTAQELQGVGINMNFAPVLDTVPFDDDTFVMTNRVFGDSPRLTADLGTKVIGTMQSNGLAATGKHFPGIGRTTLDSHADLPFLETKEETLRTSDLIPFRAAVEHGVAAIMLAHVIYTDIDPEWPASLSSRLANDLLRQTMGFAGVTITDDLDMGAVSKHYGIRTVAERICGAQIDLALLCRSGPEVVKIAHEHLMETVHGSDHARVAHLKSVERILALKDRYIAKAPLGSP